MNFKLTDQEVVAITAHINGYRAKHHAKAIAHSDVITSFSQSYAEKLSATNTFEHSRNRQYGENLASFGGYKNDMAALIKQSIDLWYSEVKLYDYEKATFVSGTGHFTQLCWNNSTKFGVGYAFDATTRRSVVCMNFDPPGNMMGRFKDNVFKI